MAVEWSQYTVHHATPANWLAVTTPQILWYSDKSHYHLTIIVWIDFYLVLRITLPVYIVLRQRVMLLSWLMFLSVLSRLNDDDVVEWLEMWSGCIISCSYCVRYLSIFSSRTRSCPRRVQTGFRWRVESWNCQGPTPMVDWRTANNLGTYHMHS